MNDNREHKRIPSTKMSWISSDRMSHAAFIKDISMGGVLMQIANDVTQIDEFWESGDKVMLQIDEMCPLIGHVVRVDLPRVAIAFAELSEPEIDRLADELSAQWDLQSAGQAAS